MPVAMDGERSPSPGHAAPRQQGARCSRLSHTTKPLAADKDYQGISTDSTQQAPKAPKAQEVKKQFPYRTQKSHKAKHRDQAL